jgi:hypothetical protein
MYQENLKVLELFAGSRSIGKVLKRTKRVDKGVIKSHV